MKTFLFFLVLLIFCPIVYGQQFATGNLVVVKVGVVGQTLSNTGAPVFLNEYTPVGSLQKSVPLPTTLSGINKRFLLSGTTAEEGMLQLSPDGKYLTLAGYDADLGGVANLENTSALQVNRVVARVDKNLNIDNTSAFEDYADGGSPRSVISSDGERFWMTGSTGGVRFGTLGTTTSLQLNTTVTSARSFFIADGQLFTSTVFGTTTRIGKVGTGLPESAPTSIVNLPGIPTTLSPGQFLFLDLSEIILGSDVLYVADDVAGVQKFSLTQSGWVSNGSMGTDADDYRGLAGMYNAVTQNVELYAVRKGGTTATGGGELVQLIDASGYDATITGQPAVIATADAGTAFRGVAFAPVVDLLPISGIDFKVIETVAGNLLSWTTAKENVIEHFELQKSFNGRNFSSFVQQQASDLSTYSSLDKSPKQGINYYRLKIVDKTTQISYSKILQVNIRMQTQLQAWPNPALSDIQIQYPINNNVATIKIISSSGQQMYSTLLPPGTSQSKINISKLLSGNYRLVYVSSENTYSCWLHKQ